MSELVVHKVTVQQVNANGSIGTAGQVLRSDGNFSYWGPASTVSAVGGAGELQFNNGLGFNAASPNLVFDVLTSTLTAANLVVPYTLTVNAISANGSLGLPNQVLKSNGSNTYWATDDTVAPAGSNMQVQFNNNGVFGADVEFYYDSANNIVHLVNMVSTGTMVTKVISANGSVGTTGQVLTSDGTNTYWSTPSYFNANDAITFSNTITFANNITVKGISANGSFGVAGQVLTSNGTSTYWATPDNDDFIVSGSLLSNNTVSTLRLNYGNTAIANVNIDISQSITHLVDVDTFTNLPTANQVLSWDGIVWKPRTVKVGVTIADTSPVGPVDGELWYDSLTTFRTYVWSDVVTAWVDVAPVPAPTIQFINDLSDVDTVTNPPIAGSSLLGWNGLNWVPVTSIDASSGLANDF